MTLPEFHRSLLANKWSYIIQNYRPKLLWRYWRSLTQVMLKEKAPTCLIWLVLENPYSRWYFCDRLMPSVKKKRSNASNVGKIKGETPPSIWQHFKDMETIQKCFCALKWNQVMSKRVWMYSRWSPPPCRNVHRMLQIFIWCGGIKFQIYFYTKCCKDILHSRDAFYRNWY